MTTLEPYRKGKEREYDIAPTAEPAPVAIQPRATRRSAPISDTTREIIARGYEAGGHRKGPRPSARASSMSGWDM
jgi:hypothetical protein